MLKMLSKENKIVKNALKLKQKKYRDSENKFIVEGIRFVEEAIKEKMVEHIFISSKLYETGGNERILQNDLDIFEVDNFILKELCDTENPQGVVAIVKKPSFSLSDIKGNLIVIVDGVQDPGNLGTIIRTGDAAGVSGIFIIKGSVDLYNSKTLRSTMGSIFHIPVIFYDEFVDAISDLKKEGYNIYASSLDSSNSIYECNFKVSTAFVIGNEANGIPSEHILMCNNRVKIPMPGRAESLNAGVACGVMVYEALRQRLIGLTK